MQLNGKAPRWQRLVSGLFAIAISWALVAQLLGGKLSSWPKIAIALAALYGAYLFGSVAIRGKLPKSALPSEPPTSSGKSTSGGA